MLIRPALREYRIWTTDSRRWAPYRPRPDDIIISAFPKSGQTWTQQIVSSLIFQDAAVRSLLQVSPWIDGRFGPLERTYEQIEAQTHRRFLKAHLPIDGLPLYDDVKYIHVARDGRDVVMSMHNHYRSLSEARRERLSKIGAEDPVVGRPFPPIPQRPDEFFRLWLTTPAIAGQADGLLGPSYFDFEAGFWVERHRPNFLFVHYQDLLDDREGEMRRIARFLNIEPDERVWSSLVDAAGFSAMRAAGDQLMPEFSAGNPFFNKGTNGRWQGVFAQEDLALYEMKVKEKFSPDLDAWLSSGRLATGESKSDAVA
jgi:aryl sulfotransferase